jgi:hypothetical protein
MFDEEYEKEILKSPMSNITISQHIQDMSQDDETQVIANIKEADFFAIHLDKSTAITEKAQLLTFRERGGGGGRERVRVCVRACGGGGKISNACVPQSIG